MNNTNTKAFAIQAESLPKHTFTDVEAAGYLSISPSTLRKGRMTGNLDNKFESPPFVKFGRSVRYLRQDLDDWLLRHRVAHTLSKAI